VTKLPLTVFKAGTFPRRLDLSAYSLTLTLLQVRVCIDIASSPLAACSLYKLNVGGREIHLLRFRCLGALKHLLRHRHDSPRICSPVQRR
jgi:hypothetical protein